MQVLHQHCADVGRDPSEIECAVNVGLAWDEESLRRQFGGIADGASAPCVIGGSVGTSSSTASASTATPAADQVNLALRAPFDIDALEQFSNTLNLG